MNIKITRAINNNITKPLEVAFKIGINFPPKDVEIQELPQKVYAGRTQSIRCIVKGIYLYILYFTYLSIFLSIYHLSITSIYLGSSPSAVITWWKDGQYLDRPMEFVEENRTVSSVIQVNLN